MKKRFIIPAIVIVVVILAVGGYFLFFRSNQPANSTSATAINNSVLVTKTNSSLGDYLATPDGQPLYTHSGDSNGVSNCNSSCLSLWPPYQDKAATTNLPTSVGTLKRTDNGKVQFTYNGLPLYTYVGDIGKRATGNGISGFTLAKPGSKATPSSPSQQNYNYNSATPAPSSSGSSSSSSGNSW